jgi:transcriptional regulator with XRE-family HTH domain
MRSLRGESSQEEVERLTGIKQQVFSRLENPSYGKATLTTLKRIAAAFDVALLVEFIPFSQLINRVSGTPYTERGFSPETMNVPNFEEETKLGRLEENIDSITVPPELWQSASEKSGEGGGMLNVVAPSPSGVIHPPLPAVPTGSYYDVFAEQRKVHLVILRKHDKERWPRNTARKINNRRKRA